LRALLGFVALACVALAAGAGGAGGAGAEEAQKERAVRVAGGGAGERPARPSVPAAEGAAAAQPRPRSLPVSDGATVTAFEWGAGARGAVLAHGAAFDARAWDALAQRLAGAGLRVLALELRRDRAGRPRRIEIWRRDVCAGIDALRRDGAEAVFVVGASLGGRAAADCLTEEGGRAADRVVLLAPAGAAAPERLAGRKLVVLSRGEPGAPSLRALYERMPEPKELVELEGAAHAQHALRGPGGPALEERLVRFLAAP